MSSHRGTRIAPGVYDLDGEMHIDALEVCLALGVPPTMENQDLIEAQARRLIAERDPSIPVDVRINDPRWLG